MISSRLSGSANRKLIHRTVHARIGRKNFSVDCVVLRSASLAKLPSDTAEKNFAEKIAATSRMVLR
jgi:hypothetical protein